MVLLSLVLGVWEGELVLDHGHDTPTSSNVLMCVCVGGGGAGWLG